MSIETVLLFLSLMFLFSDTETIVTQPSQNAFRATGSQPRTTTATTTTTTTPISALNPKPLLPDHIPRSRDLPRHINNKSPPHNPSTPPI